MPGQPPPTRSHRRSDAFRLLVFAATLGVVLGSIAWFNRVQDPHGRYGPPAASGTPGLEWNPALRTLLELRRLPAESMADAEVVLAGDSRARQLTRERAVTVGGTKIFNLASGGANFEEVLTILDEYQPRLRAARRLILTVPLERFTGPEEENRYLTARPLARSGLRYLLNERILRNSWTVWQERLRHHQAGESRTAAEGRERTTSTEAFLDWQFRSADPRRVARRLESLRKALVPLRERGIKVVLWRPPLTPAAQDLIAAAQVQPVWDGLAAPLSQLGTVVDLTAAAEIRSTPLTFHDAMHAKETGVILEELLAR